MDRRVIDFLERRMRDSAGRGDRRDYDRRGGNRRDYDMDERRGVRGTGPYGIGGRRYSGRDRRESDYDYDRRDYADNARDSRNYDNDYGYDYDYRDYDYDYRRGGGGGDRRDSRDYDYADYGHQEMKLTKEDMHRWKQKMQNADGTKGEHFDMQQIMHVAEKLGVKMNKFDEKELCLVVNMLYSDYCRVIKKFVPVEKELMLYVELAKAFLEDADGPEPAAKLALYYFCIVDNEEV